MTNKLNILLLALIGASSVAYAEVTANDKSVTIEQPSTAQTQLKKQLNALSNLQADFNQKVFDNTGEEIMKGSGFVKIKRPEKLLWQQTNPDETLLVSNGVKTYFFDEFAEQVTILNGKQLIDSTPFALLTSNDASLWQQYDVSLDGKAFIIAPRVKENSQVEKLKLMFDDSQLTQMQVFDNTGQTTRYEFSSQKINQEIDDTVFDFVIPENVFVDDQTQGE